MNFFYWKINFDQVLLKKESIEFSSCNKVVLITEARKLKSDVFELLQKIASMCVVDLFLSSVVVREK